MPDTDHKFYLGIVGILVESAAPVCVVGLALSIANLIADTSSKGYTATGILQPLFSATAVNDLLRNFHRKLTHSDRSSLRNSSSSVLTLGHLGLTGPTLDPCFPAPFSSMFRRRPELMRKVASKSLNVQAKGFCHASSQIGA